MRNVPVGEVHTEVKLAYTVGGELAFLATRTGGFIRGTISVATGVPVAENVVTSVLSLGDPTEGTAFNSIIMKVPAQFAVIRSVGQMLQPSPWYGAKNNRVLFGGSANNVILSADGGVTWKDIFSVEGTSTPCDSQARQACVAAEASLAVARVRAAVRAQAHG